MFELIEKDIRALVKADEESLQYVLSHFKLITQARGQMLLREGEICRNVWFINKGCVQIYYLDNSGEEATRDIFIEGRWVTNIDSFTKQTVSREFYKTLEPCEFLSIDRDSFFRLIDKVPAFMEAYRQILETSYSQSIKRVHSLNGMSSLERLQWLKVEQPQLLTRVSSKIIASYIGISPETFSRLKAKW